MQQKRQDVVSNQKTLILTFKAIFHHKINTKIEFYFASKNWFQTPLLLKISCLEKTKQTKIWYGNLNEYAFEDKNLLYTIRTFYIK